ncbi:hypothetical protein K431DRAFT_325421 [Polychaeton citri CBS 116435]|uniref:RBR-type E3 ubiquitin transferase n=1 Tax=Polychaeton citri CBS 116435 TaxID=1314669 RepID=A0A9P4PYW2_9PEZI|nr:hypothetical protein K431DRAFT_325421 [Polychaeton citri CBS 116435]
MSDSSPLPLQRFIVAFRANVRAHIAYIESVLDEIEARSTHRNPGLTTDLSKLLLSSPEPESLRECTSCLQAFPLNHFPWLAHHHTGVTRPLGSSSNRDSVASSPGADSICFDCWSSYLDSQIRDKVPLAINQIKCAECEHILGPRVIEALCTVDAHNMSVNPSLPPDRANFQMTDYHSSYLNKETQALLSADPDFHWCPSPTCTNGFYVDTLSSFTPCSACGARLCNSCAVPWHPDETCEDYQARTSSTRNEILTEVTISRISKPCPNPGCGMRLRKSGGCDHITCPQCLFQFCWRCGVPYRGDRGIFGPLGNAAHLESCEWYWPDRQDEEAVRRFDEREGTGEDRAVDEAASDGSADAVGVADLLHLVGGGLHGVVDVGQELQLDPAQERALREDMRRLDRMLATRARQAEESDYASPIEPEREYVYSGDEESDY